VDSGDDKVVRFPRRRAGDDVESIADDLAAGALKSGWLTQGQAALRLRDVAEAYLGRRVVPVAGGSAGLHLALLAVDVSDGGEVILPAISPPATANLVILAGGRPIFADIEAPDRPFLDAADANRLVGPRTRAVLTVHEAGYPALTDGLRRVADDRGVTLIEDCRAALGATVEGRSVGGAGALAVFAFGDGPSSGGLVATTSEHLERHLITLRSTVIATDDECFSHDCADGMANGYRIDEAAATGGVRALTELADVVARRRDLAAEITVRLTAAGLTVLGAGANGAGARPNWRSLIALAPSRERRDALVADWRRAGIDVAPPTATFAQPAQLHRRALPNTRAHCDLALRVAVVPGAVRGLARRA
jgi:dTDP-4-amino-4,6-dideoxygalactose transaminase